MKLLLQVKNSAPALASRAMWIRMNLTRMERLLGAILFVVALRLAQARTGAPIAFDFRAMWEAGNALLHAQPLYRVPDFVYPPFAALVFAPFAELTYPNAAYVYSVIQVLLPMAAALLLAVVLSRQHRWLLAGIFAVLLLKADVYTDSLTTYNPSLLFVLPFVSVVLLWSRQRWAPGALILGLSLAMKPLLVLLILIPLLRRDWRTATFTAIAAAVPTAILLPFVHDLNGLAALPGRILRGTSLHGEFQVFNVSLSSVAVVHPSLQALLLVMRVALLIGVALLVWRVRNKNLSAVELTVLAGALGMTLPVLGSLNEIHYCLLALPPCAALLSGRMGLPAHFFALIAFVVLWFPLSNLHASLNESGAQLRWAAGSTLTLFACCLARFPSPAVRQGTRA